MPPVVHSAYRGGTLLVARRVICESGEEVSNGVHHHFDASKAVSTGVRYRLGLR